MAGLPDDVLPMAERAARASRGRTFSKPAESGERSRVSVSVAVEDLELLLEEAFAAAQRDGRRRVSVDRLCSSILADWCRSRRGKGA